MEQLKINVPEGCTANIKKEDGFLIVTFEQKKEEKWRPKDGDIVTGRTGTIAIYAGTNEHGAIITYAGLNMHLTLRKGPGWGYTYDYRPATEEEKQRLFDALAKEGMQWNAEKKRIEYLPRWRQKHDECYYFIDSELNVSYQPDVRCKTDNNRHEAGNYFKTKEAVERVASQIREILKKSKAE